MIEKDQLVALNVENCTLRPLIAKVLEVKEDNMIDIVWLEGSYSRPWKIAKQREGRTSVDWVDSIPKSAVLLFDFQLTRTDRLRKATVTQLKEVYAQIDS